MLLSSHRPFQAKKRKLMIDKIMRADYKIRGQIWEGISAEAIDLVKQLIEVDPQKRLNSTTALQHVWLSEEFEPFDSGAKRDSVLDRNIVASMVAYGNSSKLKKIAMNVSTLSDSLSLREMFTKIHFLFLYLRPQIIAHRSTSQEIVGLKEFFNEYDTSNDGIIDLHEFKAAMKKAKYPGEAIEAMFQGIVSRTICQFSSTGCRNVSADTFPSIFTGFEQ
jgi:calcium-dependent protein kinase